MSDLFRQEAIDFKRQRLHGKVRVTTPRAGAAMIGVLLAVLAVVVAVLALGSYDRRERVVGWLVPEHGLVRLSPAAGGIIAAVHVAEGDLVEEGAALITVMHDVGFEFDRVSVAEQVSQLDEQHDALEAQLRLLGEGQEVRADDLRARLVSLDQEGEDLRRQVRLQERRYALARAAADQDAKLHEQGVLSRRALTDSEESALALQQAALAMRVQVTQRDRERSAIASLLDGLGIDRQARAAGLRAELHALEQRRSALARQGQSVLRAPIRGRVASLQAEVGESVRAGQRRVDLLPAEGELEAVLFAPPQAIGLVREGQPVRLRFDAFPYATFGMGTGQTSSVSTSVLNAEDLPVDLGLRGPVYRVRVRLDAQALQTPRADYPLQAGMTLEAHLVLERRRLWQVLLGPLVKAWG